MSYLCTCPGKGSFEGADGTIRCVACAQPEEIEAEIVRLRAERDRVIAERDALRAVARALLDDVESPSGEPMEFCHALRCRRLAMCGDGDMVACDEHQGILVAGDIEDLSYAPAVRSLRSLLPKEGA